MEQDLIEVITPSNYKAYIKPELTFGQFSQIQQTLSAKMSFDPKNGQVNSVGGDIMLEANKKALSFLLVKLIDPKGEELASPEVAIDNISSKDGLAIMDKINEITTNASLVKKKES